ncbi:MAG TPA: bifunctional nuclease domain-containing protein [Anaerolineae bacterium]|nr:bifunctional nuclease domain-containing protein [Anaerolineae bacterium]
MLWIADLEGFSGLMQKESDAALVRYARVGDKRAFGELVARYQAVAQRVAQQIVRDDDLARDLAQEAILQAYLSLGHLRDEGRFGGWLYGIVLHVCRSYLRAQKTTSLSLEAMVGGLAFEQVAFASPEPQQIVEERELHQLVLDAINRLSPENREVTLRFYYDGLSLREIATLLGISITAVKGRLFKSRQQLKQQLLTIYAEPIPSRQKERSVKMIPVRVVDVVRRERSDSEGHGFTLHVVVLYDQVGQRALPIWVGPFEGEAIAMGVLQEPVPRPMTFDFMAKLLEAANARVEEVNVAILKEDVFYASVKLQAGEVTRELDARPSDAIALALRTGSPILVAEEVMERAGKPVPKFEGDLPSPPRGIDELSKVWQANYQARSTMPQLSKEEFEQSQRELLTTVFG